VPLAVEQLHERRGQECHPHDDDDRAADVLERRFLVFEASSR